MNRKLQETESKFPLSEPRSLWRNRKLALRRLKGFCVWGSSRVAGAPITTEGQADLAAGLGEGACSGCDAAGGEQIGGDGWSPETPPSMKMSMDGFHSTLACFLSYKLSGVVRST